MGIVISELFLTTSFAFLKLCQTQEHYSSEMLFLWILTDTVAQTVLYFAYYIASKTNHYLVVKLQNLRPPKTSYFLSEFNSSKFGVFFPQDLDTYLWLKSPALFYISIHSFIKNIHGGNTYSTAGNFPPLWANDKSCRVCKLVFQMV